jgi:uncharacterized phage protein (predicted DNA packaging)
MATITLDQLKSHLNVTITDDDALLTDKLAAATAWVDSYTGGSEATTDRPAPVNEAILQLAASLYENREATLVGVQAQQLPFGFVDLLANYRAWAF